MQDTKGNTKDKLASLSCLYSGWERYIYYKIVRNKVETRAIKKLESHYGSGAFTMLDEILHVYIPN